MPLSDGCIYLLLCVQFFFFCLVCAVLFKKKTKKQKTIAVYPFSGAWHWILVAAYPKCEL